MPSSKYITRDLQSLSLCTDLVLSFEDFKSILNVLGNLYSHFVSLKCRNHKIFLPLPIIKDHIKSQLTSVQLRGQLRRQISSASHAQILPDFAPITFVVNNYCDQGSLFGMWIPLYEFGEVVAT